LEHGTVLYIVRHTDVHNPEDILYGRLPRFGLSDLGRRQAQVTARVLADVPVSVFYTSPMLRARQTTEILAGRHPGVPVHVSEWLNEVKTGWQGRPHSELEGIRFDFYNRPIYPHDEDLTAIWVRISRFVRRARRAHEGGTVVAVTHGDIFGLARAGFRGLPIDISSIRLPHPYPGKGALLKFTFDDADDALPAKVQYYDPNGEDAAWSLGWVELERVGIGD
jgi:broad specificity phosphatase PhoE